MPSEMNRTMSARMAAMCLVVMGIVYGALAATHWNMGHMDFGDGNYMYISWRMSQGAALYRDILAPQPPLHLGVGMTLAWLGRLLPHPIYAFRAFSLILHLATMIVVYLAALRVAGGSDAAARARCRAAGVLTAIVYLLIPIGFWWTLGYQSEPLEMFLMMTGFLLFLKMAPRAMAAAGLLQGLAVLTNMTAAPYALFSIGWLALRRRALFLRFTLPCIGIVAVVSIVMEIRTGAYCENVFLNQVGSFPRPEFLPAGQTFWGYAWGKLLREGSDVLRLDGGYILLGLLGLARFARRGPRLIREYASFYAFFGLCSILYVAKGGTVDYIFTIGEPFAAVFAGYFLFHFWRKHIRGMLNGLSWGSLSGAAAALALAAAGIVVCGPGLSHSWLTLKQQTYELNEYETRKIADEIIRNAGNDGLVLSPPHYAFIAQRKIAQDYSELLLWTLKYHNERQDKVRGRGTKTVETIARLLDERKIGFVILDLAQTGRIPEIAAALNAHYQPLRGDEYRTLNARLQFYLPK